MNFPPRAVFNKISIATSCICRLYNESNTIIIHQIFDKNKKDTHKKNKSKCSLYYLSSFVITKVGIGKIYNIFL